MKSQLSRLNPRRAIRRFFRDDAIFVHPNAKIGSQVYLPQGTRVPSHVDIGSGAWFASPPQFVGGGAVVVGEWAAIGARLNVISSNHDPSRLNMHIPLQRRLGLPDNHLGSGVTVVGPGAWVGDDVTVLAGVRIGAGAVVGASSVVTKNIEPFTINAGVPSRPLGDRCSRDVAARLVDLAWWEWSVETMSSNLPLFEADLSSLTVEGLDAILLAK